MESARINEKDLLTVRDLLPHGSGKKIADKLGCTPYTVSRVLNGKSIYPGVIEEALKIIEKRKSLVEKVKEVLR